jgi:trk system potassium uptake protein TrkA
VHELRHRFLRGRGHGPDRQSATIVGGGSVGFSVARGLEAAGWRVRLIETSGARCREIAPQLKGLVIHGDGSDIDLLRDEGVAEDPVLIAVTSNDEKNLLVSLIARKIGVERVITRADRLSNEKLFESVGIDVVRSARGAAIRRVVRDVVDAQSAVRLELEHGDVHVVELVLPMGFPPTRLRDHRWDFFAIVGAVIRGRDVLIPNGDTQICSGDHLMVFTSQADEAAVLAHFGAAEAAGGRI